MNEIQHIEQQIRALDQKVSSILVLLRGNELDKEDKGMIGVENDHEKRIARMEKIIDRGTWLLIGTSLFAGWGILDIIRKLLIK